MAMLGRLSGPRASVAWNLFPMAFVAVTVKVYAVPLARPVTVIEVQGAVQLPVIPFGDEVAV